MTSKSETGKIPKKRSIKRILIWAAAIVVALLVVIPLGIAVYMHLETVYARSQIVTGTVVHIDAHTIRALRQTAAGKALPPVAVADKLFPAHLISAADQPGIAVVSFRGELSGI